MSTAYVSDGIVTDEKHIAAGQEPQLIEGEAEYRRLGFVATCLLPAGRWLAGQLPDSSWHQPEENVIPS